MMCKKYLFPVMMIFMGIVVLSGCSKDDDDGFDIPKGLEAIDLGLPSGTKWANMNVGALSQEKTGDYYAWGETEKKTEYSWETYTHCDGTQETCHDLGGSIIGTRYDVAHVKWGGDWQMPSMEQVSELINCCTTSWTTINGVWGCKFVGPNGHSIFIPEAGTHVMKETVSQGHGFYWAGDNNPENQAFATRLYFTSKFVGSDYFSIRYIGQPVRPVLK